MIQVLLTSFAIDGEQLIHQRDNTRGLLIVRVDLYGIDERIRPGKYTVADPSLS